MFLVNYKGTSLRHSTAHSVRPELLQSVPNRAKKHILVL